MFCERAGNGLQVIIRSSIVQTPSNDLTWPRDSFSELAFLMFWSLPQ